MPSQAWLGLHSPHTTSHAEGLFPSETSTSSWTQTYSIRSSSERPSSKPMKRNRTRATAIGSALPSVLLHGKRLSIKDPGHIDALAVNFGPGAGNDVAARIVAAEFAQDLGGSFVVKNSTGAAGTIGAIEAVRARPDGQTLLLSPIGPVTIQPSFMRNAGYRDGRPRAELPDDGRGAGDPDTAQFRPPHARRPGSQGARRGRRHALRLHRAGHADPPQHGGLDAGRPGADEPRPLPQPRAT